MGGTSSKQSRRKGSGFPKKVQGLQISGGTSLKSPKKGKRKPKRNKETTFEHYPPNNESYMPNYISPVPTPSGNTADGLELPMSQLNLQDHSISRTIAALSLESLPGTTKAYDVNRNMAVSLSANSGFQTLPKSTGKRKKGRAPLPPNLSVTGGDIQKVAFVTGGLMLVKNQDKSVNSNFPFQFVNISSELLARLLKHPTITSIPFPLPSRDSACITNSPWHTVPLPFKIPYSQKQQEVSFIWPVVTKKLYEVGPLCQQGYKSVDIIYTAISTYHPNAQAQSNFGMLTRPDIEQALQTILPAIASHALLLPNLLQQSIPILNSGESKTIYLTRQLCCSLLANAFFCTFPSHELSYMPDFNFFRLYNDTSTERCEVKKEKLRCILAYFNRLYQEKSNERFLNQILSFERRCIPIKASFDWATQNIALCDVKVEVSKKIEDAVNMLQVDFANKLVGGGVLNDGSVMEEIRFSVCPELIVSRLFTQSLKDEEVLVVTGSEIYSQYTGYGTSFKYKCPNTLGWGSQPVDNFGRTYTQIVAMDATSFKKNDPWTQFDKRYIDRDLHKCKVAFMHGKAAVSPVATGNWGCGAFNGNKELKFMIQWMAASLLGRPFILYHTAGDQVQGQAILDIHSFVKHHNISVGQLYQVIIDYRSDSVNHLNNGLFAYVKYRFGSQN